MGISPIVIGFLSENDPTYKKHEKVLLACIEAGIKILPKETAEYFESEYPEYYLLKKKLKIKIPTHKCADDASQGFEIIISEIPIGIHKIRFVNSWYFEK